MAERSRKTLGRSASTESTEYSLTMGRSVRDKKKKPKERWLLTRKTWRYMADAGRKLIPDGAQNRPEDIPKIEAYFQEVCKREPKFLLWRKNSYPGALAFRKKVRKERRKGGSCRKASSADSVDLIKLERPTDLALPSTSGARYDIQKMKYDFLNKPSPTSLNTQEDLEEKQLLSMLEQYLTISEQTASTSKYNPPDFNYQELIDKLQRHLTLATRSFVNVPTYQSQSQVHFNGDHVQKSLSETLSRYFGQHTNRDKVISDLLTDRKALEKLYFDLRKARGFRRNVSGSDYSSGISFKPNLSKYPIQSSNYEKLKERMYESHPPPLIEIENESASVSYRSWGIQTLPVPESVLLEVEEKYKKAQAEKEEEERRDLRPAGRRRSSVDNDDISQSVSDTIKRYLRMARKKSVDTDKVDRFKRVNYDRNLRNIKAKGEITKPGDDDGLNKGCQTNDDWILKYRDLKFDDFSDIESRLSSSRSSVDENNKSSPSSPPPTKSHSFLSHLLHKHDKHDKGNSPAVAAGPAMQKSKSSSSVMHHGSRLMAKKIFRSRSKSQTRPSQATCSWTPQGGCVWSNLTGRQVVLGTTSLLHLTDIERKVLQKVALAKLQALNLGVAIKVPTENVGAVVSKPKRRPYLLKRKALTTSIFDTNRKEGDKEGGSAGGLVFGIPLTQCVENDRLTRAAARTSPFRSGAELSGSTEEPATMGRHGSRSSFSSLIEAPQGDESGSCESLMLRERLVGSVPGLLDTLSCGSTSDLPHEEEASVPNILSECFRHLEQHGLHTLGIFRVSTSKKRIRQLREDFDCGKETSLDDDQCPHDVATLLKEYLRDLPDPLLCRDLYQAFVQTQRIRNRRLQFEALQHLIQLLPTANRDTLYALLGFLATVAQNAADTKDESGECVSGNKMDSNNLATVFAPNILHCIKPGSSKEIASDRPEDRIDIINVVRTLIDHYKQLYTISAELLDEIYVHMMDSHPEALDQLLNKRDALSGADESVEEVDSESYSAPWSPTGPTPELPLESEETKKMYSREEFLHERAAMGGPNVGMRIRHKDRIRERSSKKRRDESTSRKKKEDEGSIGSGISSAMHIISRLRGQKDDDYQYSKNRSSSLESNSSAHTDSDINRVLRLEDDRRKSSPYILDNSGVITASLTIPVQTATQPFPLNLDDDIPYIEDAENSRQQITIGLVRTPTAPPRRRQRSISGSDSSVASNVQPITGSISLIQGYDSAVGSSATYSSPVQNTSSSTAGDAATSPDSVQTVNYMPEELQRSAKKTPSAATLQKVSFSSTQEVQQIKPKSSKEQDLQKSFSVSTFEQIKTEPKHTPSISSIGNAVLRSRTADFERITKVEVQKPKASSEKKKYTKRRYTDSRHQTRHIPDSESLESANAQSKKEDTTIVAQAPVYKRRELISSVPSK
nr:PREDICTED: uncharacterized protein LOC656511 [Tribolium castaneum]|eukprot:XP_968130.4 PREDICTED: uncharacterized protein LOC656511 [Tribolium castaneum]